MLGLRKFLASLNDLPEETPIEPELKTNANKERDREIKCVVMIAVSASCTCASWKQQLTAVMLMVCREQQDLRAGAVLQAVTQQGEGDDTPDDGDLVRMQQLTPVLADQLLQQQNIEHLPAALDCAGVRTL